MKKKSFLLTHSLTLLFNYIYLVSWSQSLMIQSGHSSNVRQLSVSKTGHYFVSAADDRMVKIWELSSGKLLRSFRYESEAINAISISPDGIYVAASANDNTVRIWNIESGTLATVLDNAYAVTAMAFSPDNNALVCADVNLTIVAHNISTNAKIIYKSKHTDRINKLIYSSDGQYLISISNDKTISIWPHEKARPVSLNIHQGPVIDISTTKDPDRIITCSLDGAIKEWSINEKSEKKSMTVGPGTVSSISANEIGDNFAMSVNNESIKIGVLKMKSIYHEFGKTKVNDQSIARFSSDGKYIIYSGYNGNIHVYNVFSKKDAYTISAHTAMSLPHHLSTNCYSIFASVPNALININISIDESTGIESLLNTQSKIEKITSIDCRYFAGSDSNNNIHIWKLNGKGIIETHHIFNKGHIGKINDLCFGNNYTVLASCSDDMSIKIWDTYKKGMPMIIKCNSFKPKAIKFSNDGKLLAAQLSFDSIHLIDPLTGKIKITLSSFSSQIEHFAFSSNHRILFGINENGIIFSWDLISKESKRITQNPSGHISAFTLIKGDKDLLACTGDDKIIRLWDISGNLIHEYLGHEGEVSHIASFEYNKQVFVISSSKDKTLKIWDSRSNSLLASLMIFENGLSWVAWTPDGRYDYSTNGRKYIHYVNGSNYTELPTSDPQYKRGLVFEIVGAGQYIDFLRPAKEISHQEIVLPKPPLPLPGNPVNGKDYALFFVVEHYEKDSSSIHQKQWKNIEGSINEINQIAEELKTNYGFHEVSIVVDPKREEIMDTFVEYQKRNYDKEDQLLIFFSMHGQFDDYEGALIPLDGKFEDNRTYDSWITYPELYTQIKKINCKHILLAIDACYSGASLQHKGEPQKLPWEETPSDNCISKRNKALKYQSRLLLTSGGKERTPNPSQFARKWLEALRAKGNDGILHFYELYSSYLLYATPTPLQGEFNGHEPGGGFIFMQKSACGN